MNRKLALSLCVVFVAIIHSADSRKLDYGEPCVPGSSDSNSKCDEAKNLECSNSTTPNVCACKKSSEYQNQIEYDRELKACFHIPGVMDSFSCQTDGQCKLSSYGSISRCNKEEGRCECFYEKEETQLVDNICFLAKPISFGKRTVAMKVCSQDQECTSSTLGQFSRCNLVTHTCECFDTATNGKQPSAPYNGKCVLAKRLEEFCDSDDECRVGSLVNAVCSNHPNYLSHKEKVCVCPPDVQCEDVNGTTLTVANTVQIGFLSILAWGISNFH